MTRRPTKCPICGNKITRVTNAVTKNSYFKCLNKDCYFALSSQYTDEEFSLQGRRLQTTCLKCGEPLTVVNGPHGLYPRCLNCSCDSEPTLYNGKMYSRWVNAHRVSAKEEIEKLINSFNAEDAMYDFDSALSEPTNSTEKDKKTTRVSKLRKDSIKSSILNLLRKNLNKGMGANEIGSKLNKKYIRMNIKYLKQNKLIKVVGYNQNHEGKNFELLYQLPESALPELKIYEKSEGYTSVSSFLKERGCSPLTRKAVEASLKRNKVSPVPFNSLKGICIGYSVLELEKVLADIIKKKRSARARTSLECSGRILSVLGKNVNSPYTIQQIANEIGESVQGTSVHVKKLRNCRKLKIVGWDRASSEGGPFALQYQLAKSPLPKFKVTTNKRLYMTLHQYYNKNLRGRQLTSPLKATGALKNLQSIPLLVHNKAYEGYLISDLKGAFEACVESNNIQPRAASKRTRKEVSIPVDVEGAVLVSQKSSQDKKEKKSVLNYLFSIFRKEQKIPS